MIGTAKQNILILLPIHNMDMTIYFLTVIFFQPILKRN